MMSFNKLNDEANYYSELSGKTGINSWDQDKFQAGIISMIQDLNLTKEQIEKLGNFEVPGVGTKYSFGADDVKRLIAKMKQKGES